METQWHYDFSNIWMLTSNILNPPTVTLWRFSIGLWTVSLQLRGWQVIIENLLPRFHSCGIRGISYQVGGGSGGFVTCSTSMCFQRNEKWRQLSILMRVLRYYSIPFPQNRWCLVCIWLHDCQWLRGFCALCTSVASTATGCWHQTCSRRLLDPVNLSMYICGELFWADSEPFAKALQNQSNNGALNETALSSRNDHRLITVIHNQY